MSPSFLSVVRQQKFGYYASVKKGSTNCLVAESNFKSQQLSRTFYQTEGPKEKYVYLALRLINDSWCFWDIKLEYNTHELVNLYILVSFIVL